MFGMRGSGLFGAAILSVGAAGCVSLTEYDQLERRCMQQQQVIEAADARVSALQSENQEMRSHMGSSDAEIQAARNEAAAARQALEEARARFNREASEALVSLGTNVGEFTVNRDTGGIILEGDILFRSGSADLTSEGQQVIGRLAGILDDSQYASYQIEVAGHTDNDPIVRSHWQDNWQLSSERARGVLLALVASGVPQERCHFSGWAYFLPRDESDAHNRRVEVLLTERRPVSQ